MKFGLGCQWSVVSGQKIPHAFSNPMVLNTYAGSWERRRPRLPAWLALTFERNFVHDIFLSKKEQASKAGRRGRLRSQDQGPCLRRAGY